MRALKLLTLSAALLIPALPSLAVPDINNPVTQAVLEVYAEQIKENPSDYNAYYNRANEYYRHDEYIRALNDIDKALNLAPPSDDAFMLQAYILRAGIYDQTKRTVQALNDLNEAFKIDPTSYFVVYQKANAEYTLGKYSEAKEDYLRLQRLNPRSAEALIGLARVAVKENNLGNANDYLAQAVSIDPNNPEIYIRRASVRKQMNDHNGAVDDLILAISTDRNGKTKALDELVEYGNTNYAATVAGLSNAIAQAPQVESFRYLRGVIAQAHYNYLAAITDFKTILDSNPNAYRGLYAAIAECQYGLGLYTEALDNINYALGIIHNNASYQALRSKILRALGQTDEAINAAADALAIDRNNSNALADMALAYYDAGKYEESSNLLGEAIMNSPETPSYYLLRAWISKGKLNRETAAQSLCKTVADADQFYVDNVLSLKGFALIELDEKEKALQWMDNILNTVIDNDGLVNYYGACFYTLLGDHDKALRCVETSLDKGYADYHNWMDATDGYINVAPLRDDLRFLNLINRHNAIFGRN